MPDTMTIKCNNVPRHTLYWHELTDKERAEFDYLDTEDRQAEATFARYRGHVYDLGEFMLIERAIAPHCQRSGWERFDGYAPNSYFSAVLVKYVDNFESVIMATAYS